MKSRTFVSCSSMLALGLALATLSCVPTTTTPNGNHNATTDSNNNDNGTDNGSMNENSNGEESSNQNGSDNTNDSGEQTDNTNGNGEGSQNDNGESTSGNENGSPDGGASSGEVLFVATGEYSAMQDWHAILRIDEADSINGLESGTAVTPDATVNIQASGDTDGIMLNFVHTIFLDEAHDEMYVGSLFTTEDNHDCEGPNEVCGSIAIFANASTMDGPQTLARHLFGDQTQINQPHGIWVDGDRDILYAANTFGGNVLIWDNASTADGNQAPDRILTYEEMGAAVHAYVDSPTDRLFLACMKPFDMGSQVKPSILIYNNASTLDGEATPDVRIIGDNTRLEEGNNQTTHNVWFVADGELLIVGHHTNEVLIYDLSEIDFEPNEKPGDLDLTPRVLKINEEQDGSDEGDWSCYGFFHVPSKDRLYVAVGYTPPTGTPGGNPQQPGGPAPASSRAISGPQPGSPKNRIIVYDGISDPSVSGVYPPTREIYWDNGDQYYPPQPLWVVEVKAEE